MQGWLLVFLGVHVVTIESEGKVREMRLRQQDALTPQRGLQKPPPPPTVIVLVVWKDPPQLALPQAPLPAVADLELVANGDARPAPRQPEVLVPPRNLLAQDDVDAWAPGAPWWVWWRDHGTVPRHHSTWQILLATHSTMLLPCSYHAVVVV